MATFALRVNGAGPKFGCGLAQGGACTVLVDGIAHATGRRLRDLPFTAERVKQAIG